MIWMKMTQEETGRKSLRVKKKLVNKVTGFLSATAEEEYVWCVTNEELGSISYSNFFIIFAILLKYTYTRKTW